MPEFTAEELKGKTPEQLAILGERNHPLSAEGILIREEFERRRNEGQSIAAITKAWHETFIGKVAVSVVAGIILLLCGILLNKHFTSTPQQPQGQTANTPEKGK